MINVCISQLIKDDAYWRRRAYAHWQSLQVEQHAGSWRRLFFERNLQEVLERHGAASQAATSELRQLLDIAGEHARALRLQQHPPHLDLASILDGLPRLEELQVSCGQQDLQMGYDRALFGLPVARCRALSQCVGRLQALTHLDLSMNLLDDAKVDILAEGLDKTTAISSLVLHSNKIRDHGAATLARFVESHASFAHLDVHDNLIQAEGARALGRTLQKEQCRLTSLNMRLNEVGDEGGQAMAIGLHNNQTLKRLDIGANNIGPIACTDFAKVLQNNSTLQELDLSCNPLAPGEGGWLLHEAIRANQRVVQLDVRCSDIEDECQKAIVAVLVKRQMGLHAL